MASPREDVADALAATCVFGDLNDSYGVIKEKGEANGKTYWGVTFAKARILDGVIKVYSPNFIQIKWEGALAVGRGLPFRGHEVVRSEAAAKKFLIDHFVSP